MKNPIGAHFSIKNGYLGALKEALDNDADALQIFAKSPASAKYRSVTEKESSEVSNWEDRNKIKSLIIHSSYLINIAKEELSEGSFAIKSIAEDIRNAETLGGIGTVVHFGKKLENSEDISVKNIIKNVNLLAHITKEVSAKILLENTAGQGTEIGCDLKLFSETIKKINKPEKVGACVDTAHAFGAGYDLKTEKGAKDFVSFLKNNLGIENIFCIHLNDSKKPLSSKVDRHEDIGFGTIGDEGLEIFVKELIKSGGSSIPLILETPQEKASYKEQIKKVRSWLQ